MPKPRTPLAETVSGLRRIEITLRTAGSDGCTMSDLTAATGLVRRTIERGNDAAELTLGTLREWAFRPYQRIQAAEALRRRHDAAEETRST